MKMKLFIAILAIVSLLALAPAALAQDAITPDNASDLTELMRLGRGQVTELAFSPDGSTLAVASSVGVWLYDSASLDTVAEPPLIVTDAPVSAVAFSPDGSVVAAGDEDRRVMLFDAATQENLATLEVPTTMTAMIFTADGSTLITGGTDGTIRFWDVAAGSESALLEGHSSTISELVLSADGSVLISASEDNSVRLWDVAGAAELAVVEGHTNYVYGMALSPDGSTIVTGSADDTVRIWDAATGEELMMIEEVEDGETTIGHGDDINAVVFSPDGSAIVTGGADETVRVWDTAGEQLAVIETGFDVEDMAFSPDGSILATITSDIYIQFWAFPDGTEMAAAQGHTNDVVSVAFSPDSATLNFGNSDYKVWSWATADMLEITEIPVLEDVTSFSAGNENGLVYAPDGSFVAVSDGFDVRLLTPDLSSEIALLDGSGLATSVAVSPDSALVAFVGTDGLFVFDTAGTLLAHMTEPNGWVQTVAFSPDQTLLAVGSDDGTTRIYGLGE